MSWICCQTWETGFAGSLLWWGTGFTERAIWHEEARSVSQAPFRGKVQLPVSTAGQTPVRSVFIQTKLSSTRSPGPDDVTGAELQDQSWLFTYFLCPLPARGTRPGATTLSSLLLSLKLDFLTSTLVTFWAGSFFAVGDVLCIVGCLTASLASTYWIANTFFIYDKEKCLQTLINIPWGGGQGFNHSHLKNTDIKVTLCFQNPREEVRERKQLTLIGSNFR